MRRGLLVLAIAVGFCVVGALNDGADARPKYFSTFGKHYKSLAKKARVAKCGVCHPGKDKKKKNAYGLAVGKNVGKNEKKADAITAALTKAEAEKGAGGKTYGEQIKAGDLPK